MLAHPTLLLGIAFVAATVGYMAGGSGTPVASVAIPAVFGLVATALGLLQASQPSKDLLEYLKSVGEKGDSQPDVVEYRRRVKSAPGRIGIALIVFSIAYLAGATVGAKIRIDGLLAPKPQASEFPWAKNDTPPPTIAAALEWMALQARLSELGYEPDRIAVLYAIQVAEWKSLATQAQATTTSTEEIDTSRPDTQKEKTEKLIQEWLKQGAGKGNPFANQPSKDLFEKLREFDVPGKTPAGALPG